MTPRCQSAPPPPTALLPRRPYCPGRGFEAGPGVMCSVAYNFGLCCKGSDERAELVLESSALDVRVLRADKPFPKSKIGFML